MELWFILIHVDNPEDVPYFQNYIVRADSIEKVIDYLYEDNSKLDRSLIELEEYELVSNKEDIIVDINSNEGICYRSGKSYYKREDNQ